MPTLADAYRNDDGSDPGTGDYQDTRGEWHHGRRATGAGGWSDAYVPSYGEYQPPNSNDTTTLGKVRPFEGTGMGGGAWGGYVGEMVDDGQGGAYFDPTRSGRQRHVNQVRGLGQMAAERQAYQLDYSGADREAARAAKGQWYQHDAEMAMRNKAMGGPSASQDLMSSMYRQGVAAQQSAALSTRGGALAQAAAMQQQQAGQGAYLQQTRAQMGALRADEMTAGRNEMASALARERAMNQQSQGLAQSQAERQADAEAWQRQQNQAGQMGYEQMGQDINIGASRGALSSHEIQAGIDGAASARNQRNKDRDLGRIGAGIQAGGALVSGLSTLSQNDAKASDGDPDPYSRAISMSDERGKMNIKPMSLAAMAARKGGY